ncbi:MAG: glycosyltransferase family 4 protein [Bacteroidales bacterium]|nr:glycosyltransferase family 4 protein [Bacteroidales bacterium]
MRIVYCIDSVNNVGGIQQVTVVKANALAEVPGNEVWMLVADNSGNRVFGVSPKVRVIALEVDYYKNDWKSRWNVLIGIFFKRWQHRRRVAKALDSIDPDVLVSVGQSEKNFLPRIKGKWATIREIHYLKDYRWKAASSLFDKILAFAGDLRDYVFSINKYDSIVVLTEEDKETSWKGNPKVVVIPNPVEVKRGIRSNLDTKRVIAVGRLVPQKNFASLINAFRGVSMRHPDWRLDIYGEGPEREPLQSLISEFLLEDKIRLNGSSHRVLEEMANSSMLAMTSRFEGFGVVLIEAMSVGLPVVSYACPCGPKDIITDAVDGFLVPSGDEDKLAERICELIEDEDKRRRMGLAALSSSGRFDIDRVILLWMELFRKLIIETQGKRSR